ncbi:MAG: chorismate synthase [Rikenellaceae bacterium]
MNTFGRIFKISIFGESHGKSVGVVIDAPIAGLEISEDDFMADLARRKSGSVGTTPRKEADLPHIISGEFNGHATGAPLTVVFNNENTISKDYKNLVEHPRPGHSDFVAFKKFDGFNDYRGGGHFSARVTLGVVAAGVVAKKVLASQGITISANLIEMGGEKDHSKHEQMLKEAMKQRDSLGGIVECTTTSLPIGLGEPFFDSVESLLSHAIFSIPGVRAIEFGEGFESARKSGSQHNDMIMSMSGETQSNNAGGVNGGISNGNPIIFRVAFKPTSSIARSQMTLNTSSQNIEELCIKGRHDACIALRAPVIVEAMCAIVLCDFLFSSKKFNF